MSKTTNYQLDKYDDNTNCDFRFINGSLDKLDEELKNVSDKANTKEIEILYNITILGGSTQWVKDSTTGFFKYTMNLLKVNSKTIVNINVGIEYLTSDYNTDKLVPCTKTYDNGNVELFSTEVQTKNFYCDIEVINEVI